MMKPFLHGNAFKAWRYVQQLWSQLLLLSTMQKLSGQLSEGTAHPPAENVLSANGVFPPVARLTVQYK